jgi:hypothetical protein
MSAYLYVYSILHVLQAPVADNLRLSLSMVALHCRCVWADVSASRRIVLERNWLQDGYRQGRRSRCSVEMPSLPSDSFVDSEQSFSLGCCLQAYDAVKRVAAGDIINTLGAPYFW